MTASPPRNRLLILSLLGALNVVSPFSIDMYLPGFSQMASDLHTTSKVIALSVSSYFIGLALGQICYGPFLDRFGRKKPLYAGLSVFVATSLGCAFTPDIRTLLVLRFFQALGGGVAQVGSTAMVRDFFPPQESAKIFSLMFLFIGVSPLLAPSVGSFVIAMMGWKMIFVLLAAIVGVILALMFALLPEPHPPDPTISLKPGPIVAEFIHILKNPRFAVYALAGAFSFSGLFTYVSASPIIFMEGYHLSAHAYGIVFAVLAMSFIGCSQVNIALLRYYTTETVFARALMLQTFITGLFVLGTGLGLLGLYSTMALFFVFLGCAGVTYPNAAALALEPFTKNTGSASALLGLLQFGVGALVSTGVGMTEARGQLPVVLVLAVGTSISLAILLAGRAKARAVIAD